ncbi:hypothetical protein [Anaerosolibacter sp.]|uniref:hypothetical protein n=1 Tax=Anaerosolibacter sp. TaxID=1872527 RepID=UPI0039F0E463
MDILIGAFIFMVGYMACFFTVKKQIKTREELITQVKRVKPSLRNPLQTYNVAYERFKSRDNELYAPQKPNRGDKK